MPTYCYSTETGETVERFFAMGEAPRYIRESDGRLYEKDIGATHRRGNKSIADPWVNGLESESAGVNPEQVPDAESYDASIGVPTKYNARTGNPIFTSRSHRRRWLRAHGMTDRDGGYGD